MSTTFENEPSFTSLDRPEPPQRDSAEDLSAVRKQVRGSALLLAGRGCAVVLNLITQVILVRTLIKSDFGHLAYALSLVELLSVLAVCCMDKTFARLGAIHHERRERVQFAGMLGLSLLTPVAIGGFLATAISVGGHRGMFSHEDIGVPLLWMIACLIPFNGISSVAQSLMTVARGPREILVRRHLLGPGLKLAAVAIVALNGGQVRELSLALLVAGVLGCVADLGLIYRIIADECLQPYLSLSAIAGVWNEAVRTALSLLVMDGAMLARGALIAVLVGGLTSSVETAAFRAAVSLVKVNELVIVNFAVMFVPLASRLYAEGSTVVLWNTLRKTNAWITLLSFPVFAVTVAWAAPLSVTLFGPEYADAAWLLVILASGYFVQAAFGFHGQMLRVLGSYRAIIGIELISIAATVPTAVFLIYFWGSLGAAIAASIGVILPSLLKSWAVERLSPTRACEEFRAVRRTTAVAAGTVVCIALFCSPTWLSGGALAAAATATTGYLCRGALNISEMFPELQRVFAAWNRRSGRKMLALADRESRSASASR